MKVLMGCAVAVLLLGGSVFAAGTTTSIPTSDQCSAWNLDPASLTDCHARWKAAKTDADRAAVTQKYNPRYLNANDQPSATTSPNLENGSSGASNGARGAYGPTTGTPPAPR